MGTIKKIKLIVTDFIRRAMNDRLRKQIESGIIGSRIPPGLLSEEENLKQDGNYFNESPVDVHNILNRVNLLINDEKKDLEQKVIEVLYVKKQLECNEEALCLKKESLIKQCENKLVMPDLKEDSPMRHINNNSPKQLIRNILDDTDVGLDCTTNNTFTPRTMLKYMLDETKDLDVTFPHS